MPKMVKDNARDILLNTLQKFHSVTGEGIGAAFTWNGKLATLGPETFQNLLTGFKDETWRALSRGKSIELKPVQDEELNNLLNGDINRLNVPTLRKLVSYVTKQSVGRNTAIWKKFQNIKILFQNIKSLNKEDLLLILRSYLEIDTKEKSYRDRSPHSTPETTKRIKSKDVQSPNTAIDIVDDLSDTSSESFFPHPQPVTSCSEDLQHSEGPTSSLVTLLGVKGIEPIYKFKPIVNKKIKSQCLDELASENTFLTDRCLNAFCVLLQNAYPHVQGLQDTILSKNRQFVKAPRPSMQIHHDGALHWVCSSIDVQGKVTLYDSLMTGRTSEELDMQLSLLYGDSTGDLDVSFSHIQQQRGGADCGLFAAAVCLALATGVDPETIRRRQNKMRVHLSECLKKEVLIPFPTIQGNILRLRGTTLTKNDFKIKLWCVCNLPSFAFKNMVECQTCLKWYHKPCVGYEDSNKEILVFSCHQCREDTLTFIE